MGNIHLVTGYAGKQHVTSADQGVFHTAIFGDGQFVFDRGNKLAASVVTNNLIRIMDGDIYMQGRHIRLNEDAYVDLTIENGAQGMLRNDLIVARYTKDAVTGVEDVNLVVIKGTATNSNPTDPAYTKGDIITGHALLNDMPIYRIPLTGLNVGTPVALFEVQPGVLETVEGLVENKQERTDSLTTTTALADADYFPLYDTSAKAHRKTTWSNIKTVLSNIFAAKSHVAQHKTGGADAIAPEDIGAGRVNPNLLDNWCFGNPINQRGQTEYAGTGYAIDRWQSNSGSVTKSIVEDGVKLTAKASTYGWIFWQILKVPSDAVGQSVTGCLLVSELIGTAWRFSVSFRNASDAEIASATIAVSGDLTIPSAVIPQGTVYIRVGVYVSSGVRLAVGDAITLRAVKLELGTLQTLAHQDASGKWVLNEIPDYNEQLLRCCMSTADSADAYANNKVAPAAINAVNKAGDTLPGSEFKLRNGRAKVLAGDSFFQLSSYAVEGDDANSRHFILHNDGYKETVGTALQLYCFDENKNRTDYSVLHTGKVPNPGNFILGSYVGTGTKGADGKCSITFPFVPKYVVIAAVPGGTGMEFTFINPDTTMAVNKDTFGTFVDFHCSWTDKTLTWWLSGTGNYGAGDQLNTEGKTYRYVAWG